MRSAETSDARTMRAAVHHEYGPPREVCAVENVARPAVRRGKALVRVHAAGVNWADRSMTIGEPLVMRLGYGLRRPRQGIRGTDVAGTVVAIGAGVDGLHDGDEVFGSCTGAFAEYAEVDPGKVVPKPAGVSFEQAASVPMAGCVALQAVRKVAEVAVGDNVLVVGASGGIGSFAVQIAKDAGAMVTGVCSTANLDLVRSLGADRVIDYTQQDWTADGERYDLILDMADTYTLSERRRLLTKHGTLIPNSGEGGRWFGSVGRIIKARVVSPFVPGTLRPFLSLARQEDLRTLAAMLSDGRLAPVIGASRPLADAGDAIEVAGSGHARGKVVVTVLEQAS